MLNEITTGAGSTLSTVLIVAFVVVVVVSFIAVYLSGDGDDALNLSSLKKKWPILGVLVVLLIGALVLVGNWIRMSVGIKNADKIKGNYKADKEETKKLVGELEKEKKETVKRIDEIRLEKARTGKNAEEYEKEARAHRKRVEEIDKEVDEILKEIRDMKEN